MLRKLQESDVPAILEKLGNGQTQTALAKEYGVSQSAISALQRKRALATNGHIISQSDNNISLRSFINKAWQAREDALCVVLNAKTDQEWDLAIDAADGAATAWKRVATELSNRRAK